MKRAPRPIWTGRTQIGSISLPVWKEYKISVADPTDPTFFRIRIRASKVIGVGGDQKNIDEQVETWSKCKKFCHLF